MLRVNAAYNWQQLSAATALRHSVPLVQVHKRIVRVGGCLAVVAQWQSTGGACIGQGCPGFDSQRLPAFSLSLITSKFIYFQHQAVLLLWGERVTFV